MMNKELPFFTFFIFHFSFFKGLEVGVLLLNFLSPSHLFRRFRRFCEVKSMATTKTPNVLASALMKI